MLNKLKLIATLLIVACLFTPLSSCHYQVPDQSKQGEMVDKIEYFYALPDANSNFGVWRYLPVVAFSLPFVLALVTVLRKKTSLAREVGGVVLSLAILAYLALHYSFNRLEMGGYVVVVATISYFILSVTAIIISIRQRVQQRANHPR